ncbi:MAG: hypothetical protein HY812_13915 [Planctomycetes bacterium]|nr:hypothetical protein [Planctomycetota bacterium]
MPLAQADTVYKRDGRTVEGEIIEETDQQVVVQTKFGPITVPRAEVLRIEKGKTLVQQFKERWEAVDQDDVLALLDLADWCGENSLSREALKVYRRVIRVEADNETARKALGEIYVDGKWVNKKDMEKAEKARKEEERKAAQKETGGAASKGDTSSAGGGQTPLEGIGDVSAIVAKFLEPVQANRDKDAELAKTLEDFFAQKFSTATSEHFSLRAQLPPPDVNGHVALAEKLYAQNNALFGLDPEQRFWADQYIIFHVKQKGAYQDLIEWIDENLAEMDAESKKFFKDGGGLIIAMPRPVSAQLESETPLEYAIAHWVGQAWIEWFTAGAARSWLAEGFAAYTAVNELGSNRLYCQTNTKYANKVEIADKNSDAAYKLVCFDILDGRMEDGYRYPWNEVVKKSLNQLDFADLAKSWSIIDFLMSEHREQFKTYLLTLRQYKEEPDCLRKTFDWTSEQLDENWEKYVRATYETDAGGGGASSGK